jgi:hypothetical protein
MHHVETQDRSVYRTGEFRADRPGAVLAARPHGDRTGHRPQRWASVIDIVDDRVLETDFQERGLRGRNVPHDTIC